jgi:hypothetical protein
MPNILSLPINKKWFDMILSGEKKEEYRQIKPHWTSRIVDKKESTIKDFQYINFRNGYNPKSPFMVVECKGIEVGVGKPEWGGIRNEYVYIIKLGRVISNDK